MSKTIIVIPARLASTRLPNKPLADINGKPMIVRVMEQAVSANLGPVLVACCGSEIKDIVESNGGIAIETDPNLPSGSDRIIEALRQFDPDNSFDNIINLQGDLPLVQPELIRASLLPITNFGYDIGTLGAKIENSADINNPNVVKIAASAWQRHPDIVLAKAIYFSRLAVPANAQDHYHHIGIYAYKRSALDRFVNLPPSHLELTEKLEQLRALEAGMTIGVGLVEAVPLSVDTPDDLEQVRAILRTNAELS